MIMNENDKLYRVVVKNGCHINTKTNSNGSKAAMQFTDDHNALAGPLEIIEVDRRELTNTDYDEYNKPLTLQDIIIRDVIVPAAREALYHAFIIGYEKLSFQLKTKALPELKQKSVKFIKTAGAIVSGVKDGLAGKEPKAVQIVNNQKKPNETVLDLNIDYQRREKTERCDEEIRDIVKAMELSAVTLVACIRMLNNTVLSDDGNSSEQRIEIQKNLQALTTADVISRIELLLESKNIGLLDESSIELLSAFKEGYFVSENKKIPFTFYYE